MPMPLNPGNTRTGLFPVSPSVPRKLGGVWICTLDTGQGPRLAPRSTSSALLQRPGVRCASGAIPACHRLPGVRCGSSTKTPGGGALQYLAAWDVRRGILRGRWEPSTGIAPCGRLVTPGMAQEPDKAAERVFWVVAHGSAHRGQAAVHRLATAYANLVVVHTPGQACWRHQVEIYFSSVQRKVLTPNDLASRADVAQRLCLYEALSHRQPRPCEWKFTRAQWADCRKRLEAHGVMLNQGDAAQEAPDSHQHKAPLAA
jgi:hypothetical protein